MKSFKDFINEQSYKMDTIGNIEIKFLGQDINNLIKNYKPKIIKEYNFKIFKNIILDFNGFLAAACLDKNKIVSIILFEPLKIKNKIIPSVRFSKTLENYRGNKLGLELYEFILDTYGFIVNDKKNTQASINVYKILSKKYDTFVLDLSTEETFKIKDIFKDKIEDIIWIKKSDLKTSDDIHKAENLRVVICK